MLNRYARLDNFSFPAFYYTCNIGEKDILFIIIFLNNIAPYFLLTGFIIS